jgi:quercetin 2,3-dioxygenase
VRVIAGSSHGVAGAVTRPTTEPLVLDITMAPGAVFHQPIPATHNAFIYVFGGAVDVGNSDGGRVETDRMAILSSDAAADGLTLTAGSTAARVLLVAGHPLNEPIAQHGPFVMNTVEELHQAVADFQRGALAV